MDDALGTNALAFAVEAEVKDFFLWVVIALPFVGDSG